MTRAPARIAAITFDFGNTLVPVGRTALRNVVERTAGGVCGRSPDLDRTAFLDAWADERERQFREEVPQFREVDLEERLVRVFARIRGGVSPPGPDERWDQGQAARYSEPAEISAAIDDYSRAFVEGLPSDPAIGPMLARLSDTHDLAILSNWPLAATIDRYVEAHGWLPHLRAIVVSQRVGTIKPHPAIFAAARSALGDPEPGSILHVGDDWAADVLGAVAVGWRVAWVRDRPADSPLPSSVPDASVEPEFVLASVADLERALVQGAGPSR